MSSFWSLVTLFGLGAFHGINPAMGWLFAVALGLQEQKRGAVLRALPPIALGHALSIGSIIAVVLIARTNLARPTLRIGAAAILFAFGLYRIFRSRHPNWVGMKVGFRDLTLWSFVMASAHGAGLMLIPLFLKGPPTQAALYVSRISPGMGIDPICTSGFASFGAGSALVSSVSAHTLGHFLVTGLLALAVYQKLGVGFLRNAWFNVDLLWMMALVGTGIFIMFM